MNSRASEADEEVQCAGCREMIGPEAPIWIERGDGTISATVLLSLDEDERRKALRLWHAHCLVSDTLR